MNDDTTSSRPAMPGGAVARRHLMRALGLGAVALALPEGWTKPVVEAVFVPAQAESLAGCTLQTTTHAPPPPP